MTPAELVRLARSIVRSSPGYAWAGEDELTQAALVAMLDAYWHWDPTRGPAEPYLIPAGRCAVARHAWAFVGPVRRRPDRHRGPAVAVQVDEALRDRRPSPEELALHGELRERVAKVLAPYPFGARVLLWEYRPREVAREHGIEVQEVYRCTDRARRALRRELADYQEAP